MLPTSGTYRRRVFLDKALDEQLANVATRAQMAHVLANLLPETVLPPFNDSLITQAYASRRRITDVTGIHSLL